MVLQRRDLRRRISLENLLRDLYEWVEITAAEGGEANGSPPAETSAPRTRDLLNRRAWSPKHLNRAVGQLKAAECLESDDHGRLVLTAEGVRTAREVVRKHRLWEAYLISHADIATGMVDLSADRIEHVLDEEIIRQLEALFPDVHPKEPPQSPHRLRPAKGAA